MSMSNLYRLLHSNCARVIREGDKATKQQSEGGKHSFRSKVSKRQNEGGINSSISKMAIQHLAMQ